MREVVGVWLVGLAAVGAFVAPIARPRGAVRMSVEEKPKLQKVEGIKVRTPGGRSYGRGLARPCGRPCDAPLSGRGVHLVMIGQDRIPAGRWMP
jgi:hypothetical protein